jgi:hypothetical protein
MIIICFDKGSFSDVEIELIESSLSDQLPESVVWVLFNEFNCFLETDSGQEVSCVLEVLCFKGLDHFTDALYVLWVLENFIKSDSLDLKVREVTKIPRGKDWFFLNEIV